MKPISKTVEEARKSLRWISRAEWVPIAIQAENEARKLEKDRWQRDADERKAAYDIRPLSEVRKEVEELKAEVENLKRILDGVGWL